MKPKTFEQFLEANPYQNTRSFTKEDWESSMYEKWQDESKEVKEVGEWYIGESSQNKVNGIWRCPVFTDAIFKKEQIGSGIGHTKEEAELRAAIQAQSKNMYYALKRCRDWFYLNAKDLKIPLEGVGAPACFEEILTAIEKATPKK